MKQFEIWWVTLPAPVGDRPVLLLGRTSAFAYLERVLVAEVTSTIRAIPQEVHLGKGNGMPRKCVANLDALRTVPKSVLRERIGTIPASKHQDVKRALGHVLHWPELTSL